ncbi:chemotaxis protein chel [Phreatobacter aquaticus]|uniref:Chemotaxis protein chel n=1 Tax=Phreatobacter aquaticus TaxID=2570229 RepID=A0A4D7QKE4_9HYPH|nr:rod-binding protein [Phreatobacter aquaticus]QCK88078.1 chemotaxis protein chel [Phreatobacter aquaticus]
MASRVPDILTYSPTAPAAARVRGSREAKAWSNAQNFEQVYLNTMLGQMFNGIGEKSPMGGKQSEAWRGMLVDEYAKTISSQGGVGLANHIYRELIGAQEAAPRRLPANTSPR